MSLISNLFQPQNVKKSAAKFWKWFGNNSDRVFTFEKNQEAVLKELGEELEKINPHVTFEIGPDIEGVRELVISADGFRAAIPAVQETVKLAPELPKWKVIAFRQPTAVILTVYYGNVVLPPEDLWYKTTQKGSKIDLTLFVSGYLPTKRNDYVACSFLLLDHLLGEYTVMTRVGAIEIDNLPADPPASGLKQFEKLKAEFA